MQAINARIVRAIRHVHHATVHKTAAAPPARTLPRPGPPDLQNVHVRGYHAPRYTRWEKQASLLPKAQRP